MQQDPALSKKATAIIRRVESGEECATSTLVIAQVCGYMKWRRRADLIPIFLDFLQSLPSLIKSDTLFSDFVGANKELQKDPKNKEHLRKWDDLVIVTQMRRLDLQEIYSNDGYFDSIPNLSRTFR